MIIKNNIKNTQISFSAYKGADNYGTFENRQALMQKVNITPQKIDEIIHSSKNTDEGLLNVYNSMQSEAKNVAEAFRSLDVIVKHYLSTAKTRLNEIRQKRPYGSKIPVVGLVFDSAAQRTGGFIMRIQSYTDDLIDDFSQIIENYFHNGVNEMMTSYRKADNHLKGGIEYITLIKGENPKRNIINENLFKKRNNLDKNYKKLEKNLNDLNVTLINLANKTIEKQAKGQNKRIIVRSLIKIATAGWG